MADLLRRPRALLRRGRVAVSRARRGGEGPDELSELRLGHIQMLGKSDRNILCAGAPWFAAGKALEYMARHGLDFWLTSEDLPYSDNRVTLDRQGNIHVAKTYRKLEAHKRLLAKLKGLLGDLGSERHVPSAAIPDQRIPLAASHACGISRSPRRRRRSPG